ncbi:MAG: hypothetical protein ABSB70_16340 [Candidatus Velthaea sp.]
MHSRRRDRRSTPPFRTSGADFTRCTIRGGHYLQLDREAAVTAELERFVAALEAR